MIAGPWSGQGDGMSGGRGRVRRWSWRRWPPTTSCSVAMRCCGTSRWSVTPATSSRRSARSCASTSSPATTRNVRSAATSGAGCTRRRSWRTTTSGSGPTTTSSTRRRTRSSSTPRSPGSPRPRRRRPARKHGCVRQGARRGPRGRAGAFRPDSVVNLSAMSFGSLSGPAVEALNRGAALAGCTQNTGEGGLSASPPRRRPRVPDRHRLLRLPRRARPLRPRPPEGRRCLRPGASHRGEALTGRQPGLGGLLPAAKISPEIAAVRGIPKAKDCVSPSCHAEVRTPTACWTGPTCSLTETGLLVVRVAVGEMELPGPPW